jgi:hypothetical protein
MDEDPAPAWTSLRKEACAAPALPCHCADLAGMDPCAAAWMGLSATRSWPKGSYSKDAASDLSRPSDYQGGYV